MEKHSHIVQLREREREITFYPSGAVAPQQPVLLHENEEAFGAKIWRLARPGLIKAAFILSVVWGGMLVVKTWEFLLNLGGAK